MRKTLILIAIVSLLQACTNEQKSRQVLEDEGYTNITFFGYDCFGCSKDDMYATKFVAVNKNNKSVRGVVCGGYLKGYTIRIK